MLRGRGARRQRDGGATPRQHPRVSSLTQRACQTTWRPRPRGGTVVAMIYLVVGLDRATFAPWHENIHAVDAGTAARIALGRAETRGISPVLAAVVGPHSTVVSVRLGMDAALPQAA